MEELTKLKGLDFKVDTLPVTVYNPDSGLYVDSPKHKAVMRLDNGHIYVICTKKRTILQTKDLFHLLVKYLGYETVRNSHIIKADRNASQMAIMINNGNLFSGAQEITSYLTIRHSFDNSKSFAFGVSDIGVPFKNHFARFEYPDFMLKQTNHFEDAVDDFMGRLPEFKEVYKDHYGNYEKLHNTKATLDFTYQFMFERFNVDFSIPGIAAKTHRTTLNKAKKGKLRISRSLKAHNNSMYGLFEGFCNYSTYELFKDKGIPSTFFAHNYSVNNLVYEQLIDEAG